MSCSTTPDSKETPTVTALAEAVLPLISSDERPIMLPKCEVNRKEKPKHVRGICRTRQSYGCDQHVKYFHNDCFQMPIRSSNCSSCVVWVLHHPVYRQECPTDHFRRIDCNLVTLRIS